MLRVSAEKLRATAIFHGEKQQSQNIYNTIYNRSVTTADYSHKYVKLVKVGLSFDINKIRQFSVKPLVLQLRNGYVKNIAILHIHSYCRGYENNTEMKKCQKTTRKLKLVNGDGYNRRFDAVLSTFEPRWRTIDLLIRVASTTDMTSKFEAYMSPLHGSTLDDITNSPLSVSTDATSRHSSLSGTLNSISSIEHGNKDRIVYWLGPTGNLDYDRFLHYILSSLTRHVVVRSWGVLNLEKMWIKNGVTCSSPACETVTLINDLLTVQVRHFENSTTGTQYALDLKDSRNKVYLDELGIKPDTAVKAVKHVNGVVHETTHRFIEKEGELVGDEEVLMTKKDKTVVMDNKRIQHLLHSFQKAKEIWELEKMGDQVSESATLKIHRATNDSGQNEAERKKVEKFFEMHYERGELYMEFLKKDCLSKVGRSCNACTEWIGPESTKRTPRPFPDTSSPSHHYLPLEKTPTINVDDSTREPDDFQPRAQLRKRFFNKDIKLGDSEEIEAFSKQYIVGVDLIEEYLQHLTNIELRKLKRKQEKEKLKKLYKTGRLKNLKVCELDKYVQHYKLTTRKLTKAEKLQLLSAHISQRICQKIISNAKATTSQAPFSQSEHDSQSSSSSEESSSDDEVLNVFGGYSREHDSFGDAIMDEDSDEDDFPVGEITVNRYGRK
ncbi:Transient receptor potential cation channel subfamily A member 1, partial [Paramuricea clavata]